MGPKVMVTAWLESIFAGDQVPNYEVNSFTVDRLYNLMRKNQEEERYATIMLADLHSKTEEYRAEGERLAAILDKMGLLPGCLSQSGVASLRTLTQTALILDAADASSTNLLLNMNDCSQQSMKTSEARRMEQRSIAQLFSKTKAARQQANNLERAVSSLEEQVKRQGPELQNKAKNAGFLNSKARDYKRHIQELQKQLVKCKVEPSVNHSALVKKHEEYKKLKEDLQPMKARLDSYHTLPPDLSLARVKVEETKQELAQIEEELSRRINLMHL